MLMLCAAVGGITYPSQVFTWCLIECFSRMIYSYGYMAGSQSRLPGAIMNDVTLLMFGYYGVSSALALA